MSANNPKRLLKHKSGNGVNEYIGYGVFATTDTTVDVPCPFATVVGCIIAPVFATAAQAANGQLTLAGTPDTATDAAGNQIATVARDSSGNITIKRIAGTDSALGFYYHVFGY